MPLVLKIESELDERSATAAADRAQRIYANAAQDMSKSLSEGVTKGAREGGRAVEKMANDARAAYKRVGEATDELRQAERQLKEMRDQGARGVEVQAERVRRARRAERDAIREAADAYDGYERSMVNAGVRGGSGFRNGLRAGMDGAVSEFRSRTGVMGDVAVEAFSGMSRGAVVAAAGIAGVGAAAVVVGRQLYDLGAVWDNVADTMALRTGKIGGDLDSLMGTVRRIGPNTAASLDVIGDVTSRVSQSLGLSGAQLDAMTRTLSEFQEATGQEVDTRGLGRVFSQFDIAPADMMSGLDDIYSASVKTQTSMNDVIDVMVKAGPAAQQFGLSFRETAGLLTTMESAGIDLTRAAPSLSIALKNLAKDGQEPAAGLRDTIAEIKALTDAQRENEAINLAVNTFGGRGYTDIYNAIKDGRLEADSFNESISGTTPRLQEVIDSTKDLSEQWTMLKNNISTLAEGPATKFFNVVNDGLASMINMMDKGPKDGWDFWGPTLFGSAWMGDGGSNPPPSAPSPSTSRGALDAQHGLNGPTPPAGSGIDTFGAPPSMFGDVPWNAWGVGSDAADSSRGPLPAAPVLPVQYTPTAGMPTAVANAQARLDEAAHDAAEKQARVNQLEQSNIATADEIQKAKNDLLQSQQRQQQAERALQDAQISATDKYTNQLSSATSSMSELGAGLDSDFGISKGLAGIADNLVRFVGSLALAGPMAKLQQISDAAGDEGSGLMGILASNGAFGPQFMPNRGTASAPGAAPGASAPLAGIPQSQFSDANLQPNAARLNDVIASLFPAITDIGGYRASDPYPDHPSGRALDIMIPGYDTPQGKAYGDAINQFLHANAGALGIDSTIWRQQYQPAGGAPSMMEDRGSPTQNHMDHIHALTTAGPGGSPGSVSVPIAGPVAGPVTSASAGGFGGFPVPLPVIIVGGLPMPISAGGAGFSPPIGTPASGQGLGPAPGPGVGPSTPPLQVPSFIPGGAAGGPLGTGFPQGLPGLGGQAYPSQGGGGGIGMGGLPMAAISSAISAGGLAIDAMAPGAGQAAAAAAQIGIQLANRAIKYAGQTAGIGVSGLLETFVPAGDNPKASIGNSWLGKIAGGIASAAPAIPNAAGGKPKGQDAQSGAKAGGNTINNTVNLTNNRATEDMAGNQAVREMGAMYSQSGTQ